MHQTLSIHLDDEDGVLCRHMLSEYEPEGHPLIQLQQGGQQVDIHLTRGRLLRLLRCGAAYLAAHDPPVSAEAVADNEYYGPCLDPRCQGELIPAGDGPLSCSTCGTLYTDEAFRAAHARCDHLGGDCRLLRRREQHDRRLALMGLHY